MLAVSIVIEKLIAVVTAGVITTVTTGLLQGFCTPEHDPLPGCAILLEHQFVAGVS